MSISRDPDRIPEVSDAMLKEAISLGKKIVNVICDEPNSQIGDATAISFPAMVDFLPRAGDRIALEDDTVCEVVRCHFKVVRDDDCISLFPNVFAIRIGP